MWKKIFLVTLLIIILVAIFKDNKEHLENKKTKKELTEFERKEDNYAKIIKGNTLNYMREPKSSNAINPIDIPTLDYIGKQTKINLPQILRTKYLENLFSQYIQKSNDKDYVKINFYLRNQDSWEDKEMDLTTDVYVNHKVKKSKYNIVNKILLKINNIIKKQFVLYKYAIANLFLNKKNNHQKFGIIFILLESYGLYGYSLYIRGYEDITTKEIIFDSFEIVGYEYTSKLFLEKPYLNLKKYDIPDAAQFETKQEKLKTPSAYEVPQKVFGKPYACFSLKTGNLIKAINKMICESAYDYYGRKKEVGVWDKPCEKDNECFFFQGNKNYKNNFGKCMNGYCKMPLNVRRIGYKYYDPDTKPLCYNCDKDNWFVASKLGECCDKQKKSKNFKSPDYAFKNDLNTRMNYFRNKNFKIKKSEYIQT